MASLILGRSHAIIIDCINRDPRLSILVIGLVFTVLRVYHSALRSVVHGV